MRRSPSTIAILSGNTSDERSRNRSGVSGATETGIRSASAPGRRTLLQERGYALLGVVRRSVLAHHVLAELVGGVDAEVDLAIEGALADPDRQRAGRGDALRQLVRSGLELVRGDHPVDEAPGGRRLGIDRSTGEQHLEGALAADRAGHLDHGRSAEQTDLHAGGGEARLAA